MDVDDPDRAVEISDWDSAEARERMGQSEAMGAFATLFELVAVPPPRDSGRAVALGPRKPALAFANGQGLTASEGCACGGRGLEQHCGVCDVVLQAVSSTSIEPGPETVTPT